MKKIVCIAAIALGCIAPLSAATGLLALKKEKVAAIEGPQIKVLLEADVTSALLEVRGGYRVERGDNGALLSSGKRAKRFRVHALQEGLRWGEEYPNIYHVVVRPTKQETDVYVNGIQYKGAVSVYYKSNQHITVVNEVGIEDFLKSVLSMQFDCPMSKEALSAMVIMARTEIYEQIKSGGRLFHLTADEVNYLGYGVTRQGCGVDAAVDATKFMVVEHSYQENWDQSLLQAEQAEDLASHGLDASQILRTIYPKTSMGLTTHPARKMVR